jgi:hypothetical protein
MIVPPWVGSREYDPRLSDVLQGLSRPAESGGTDFQALDRTENAPDAGADLAG